MADRENAIRGLEACACDCQSMHCYNCPYATNGVSCMTTLMCDALALLRETKEVEDNKMTYCNRTPYVYNIGDILEPLVSYLSVGGVLTVEKRWRQYESDPRSTNNECETVNFYSLSVCRNDGYSGKKLMTFSENYMMLHMRRIYSAKDEAWSTDSKQLRYENEKLKNEIQEMRGKLTEILEMTYLHEIDI